MTSSFPDNAMQDEALYTLLCKYLLEEADAEERAWVDEWKGQAPENLVFLQSLERVLKAVTSPAAVTDANTSAAWLQLYDKMEVAPVKRMSSFRWQYAAAACLVLLVGGWWLFRLQSAEVYKGPELATLSDGSKVQLTGDAKLEVGRKFAKQRTVKLTGAATFEVEGNPDNPFIIQVGKSEVKVLGTTFTVDYQPANASLKVHVSKGKVMVIDHKQQDSVVLTDGMLLQQDNIKPVFRVASHVTDMYKKSLAFNNTPLEEVLHTLTEVYDIKVEVSNTDLLKLPVHTTFTSETPDEVMHSLATMLDATCEKINDRQYKLK
ncbi:ferric-dicitrate binding protein FerR (iron transport regulator) [Chitinophaga terrae (ex Kim and Jung 2007)]|uniref:FecR family protein n=1 Tax=Chitinophaga terrae (ex Kim and Jung 2007) TaxID=408074 RepID=UPI002789CC5B|nr:FecR domain-containing protein [Chitinophaga terrae (ex Kim and Jung 2007)]MDQ0109983.1 ferric-dicitrate binding protein FerR (iron transport regulator) [Chitinophaga terrae (ex Kim and Jung 2007)]